MDGIWSSSGHWWALCVWSSEIHTGSPGIALQVRRHLRLEWCDSLGELYEKNDLLLGKRVFTVWDRRAVYWDPQGLAALCGSSMAWDLGALCSRPGCGIKPLHVRISYVIPFRHTTLLLRCPKYQALWEILYYVAFKDHLFRWVRENNNPSLYNSTYCHPYFWELLYARSCARPL